MNRIRGEGGRFHSGSLNRTSMSSSNNAHDGDRIPVNNHSYLVPITDQRKVDNKQNLQLHNGLVYSMSGQ